MLNDNAVADLLRYGVILLKKDFQQSDGLTTVRLVSHDGWLWYVEMKNGRYTDTQFLGQVK